MPSLIATFLGLPRWAQAALGITALALLLWASVALIRHDAVQDHEREIKAEVERKSAEADRRARETADRAKADAAAETEQARKAADADDTDPWRAMTCALGGEC